MDFLDLHSMRCMLPDVSFREEYHPGVGYHLWSSSSGLQSASSRLSLWKQGNNWEQHHQTEPAHIWDFFSFPSPPREMLWFLEGFSACMENWETPGSAIPAICAPQILYGKVRKNDPSSQNVWILLTLFASLPRWDWFCLHFSWKVCVYVSFSYHFKIIIALFFSSVSEQRYEMFLLSVDSRAASTVLLCVLYHKAETHLASRLRILTGCGTGFSKPQNFMLKIIVWKVIVPQNGLTACQVSHFLESLLNS